MRREFVIFIFKITNSATPKGDAFALELSNSNAKEYQ